MKKKLSLLLAMLLLVSVLALGCSSDTGTAGNEGDGETSGEKRDDVIIDVKTRGPRLIRMVQAQPPMSTCTSQTRCTSP